MGFNVAFSFPLPQAATPGVLDRRVLEDAGNMGGAKATRGRWKGMVGGNVGKCPNYHPGLSLLGWRVWETCLGEDGE